MYRTNEDWELGEYIVRRVLDGFLVYISRGGSLGRFPKNITELEAEVPSFLSIQKRGK